MKFQINLPVGFKKTMQNDNVRGRIQNLEFPRKGSDKRNSKSISSFIKRCKIRKQEFFCPGIKPVCCKSTVECSLPSIADGSHAWDLVCIQPAPAATTFVIKAYSHWYFYLLCENQVRIIQMKPASVDYFPTTNENRNGNNSFLVRHR